MPSPSNALSLYSIEENLLALSDSLELLPAEEIELRLQCLDELADTGELARNKRDNVARFIKSLKAMEAAKLNEIEELKAGAKALENTRRRIQEYVASLVKQYAPVREGASQKLEGNAFKLRIQKNPRSVRIADESALSDRFKRVTVVMNWAVWKGLIEMAGIKEVSVERADMEVMKSWIANALEAGEVVLGAEWEADSHHLRID